MPNLVPFRALRFAPGAAADPSLLLCPPYDVIDADEQRRLAQLSEHNAIHLELPLAGDADPYTMAVETLVRWTAQGVLMRDERPLLYIYEQRFAVPGAAGDGERIARSFFCRLRLESYGPGSSVLPHEHTMSGPREDRFRMLTATRTNLSPILLLYDDGADGELSARLLDGLTQGEPILDALGPAGVRQRLWLADPASSDAGRSLLDSASGRQLSIADGHHRYETALRYREQADAPRGADHVLALMYEAHSGGLALLPWHRVVGQVSDTTRLFEAADRLFDSRSVVGVEQVHEQIGRAGVIGMWARSGGRLLTVDRDRLDSVVGEAASEELRWLDVNVLSATLPAMVGATNEDLSLAERISYTSDPDQAVRRVDSGAADVCFLMAPTPVESVLSIASNGEFMPPKSTYFHPKAATGLVFNSLVE